MSTKTIIHSIEFDTALELADALTTLVTVAQTFDKHAVVYTDSDGHGANGTARLIERPLSDGRLVYDIEIRDRS